MKYQHRQSLEIAVSAEFDEKFKTYLVTLQDGSTKNVSSSTFKRWWKKLNDDVEVGTPEANAIANDIEEILDDDNNAGDGTPLNEVGKEIAEQAKQKAEQAKLVPMPGTQDPDWGKKHYAPNVRQEVFDSILQFIKDNSTGLEMRFCKVPYFVSIKKDKKAFLEVRVGKKNYTLNMKEETAKSHGLSYVKYNNYYLPAGVKDIALDDREILASLLK